MSNRDNGGPAFPADPHAVAGMTLRDYFAAKASDGDITDVMMDYFDCFTEQYSITRQQARYIHADAMLQERGK